MEQLKQEAKQIRDESLANQNTATRVGGWMVRLLERLQEVFQKKIGSKHDVEVETVDYGSTPSSSMTFDGDTFHLKLQIPRGKDGDDGDNGESPYVNNDGNWQVGSITIPGTSGYQLTWDPENPKINTAGVLVDSNILTVSCKKKNLFGHLASVANEDWELEATYKKRHNSGLETTLETKNVSPVTEEMQIAAQVMKGSDYSNKLELTIRETESGNILAYGQVAFNIMGATGAPGNDGQPGGTYIPVMTGPNLGFKLVGREGDTPLVIAGTRVVPELVNGYWYLAGTNSGVKGDVSDAEKTANQAIQKAQNAEDAVSEMTASMTTLSKNLETVSQTATTAKGMASSASSTASSAYSLADSAATAATNAKNVAARAKILATNTTGSAIKQSTGTCPAFDIAGMEYVVIDIRIANNSLDICATDLMTTADKICYILYRNTDSSKACMITFSTGNNNYAPASSISIAPNCAREISYFKSSITDETYISWGPEIKLL